MKPETIAKVIKWWLIICVIFIALFIGRAVGHWQSKDWSYIRVHHQQELKGYQYCPYCGERLKKRYEEI